MKVYRAWFALALSWMSAGLAIDLWGAEKPVGADVVRRVEIDPATPVFIPVHPRIATTVSFPRPIGEPMGTGFVEAEAFQKAMSEGKTVGGRGEYLITFSQGDAFFTVQPMQQSELLNLNVPFEGETVVLFFYLVEQPLAAVASLNFIDKPVSRVGKNGPAGTLKNPGASGERGGDVSRPVVTGILRSETAPAPSSLPASPARLEGLLRKLKLVHAAHAGSELDDLASALKLNVAISAAEDPQSLEIPHPVNRSALFELVILRAARDSALDSVGFVTLFRNTSEKEIVFDLRTLSVRCGAALYTARVIDAPASLRPGEVLPGYFVIVGADDGRPAHLLPGNDWRVSVDLVSPGSSPDLWSGEEEEE
ncbi:hypothetical protein DB347_17525 [Opitutaceae bacterium EW11]|nr:hypothetical protein DB347_17525 [Opitutaceae bacterium EW11]